MGKNIISCVVFVFFSVCFCLFRTLLQYGTNKKIKIKQVEKLKAYQVENIDKKKNMFCPGPDASPFILSLFLFFTFSKNSRN